MDYRDMAKFAYFCVAEGSDQRGWEAICLDLDIAVQGSSFEEVRGLLKQAVGSYIEDALKESAADRERLLGRRAPLLVRLHYISRLALSALLGRNRDGDLHGSFQVPCRA